MHTTTLGIDVAKNVFQLHGVNARGRAVLSRRVKRRSYWIQWRTCRPA